MAGQVYGDVGGQGVIRDVAAEGGSLKEALMNLADRINV
jgi:hypothetical protein